MSVVVHADFRSPTVSPIETAKYPMWVHNEWDPLEEVIVGNIDDARVPQAEKGIYAIDYRDLPSQSLMPTGLYPDQVIDETREDLDIFATTLRKMGIVVQRPGGFDLSKQIQTPFWTTDSQYLYCPRDTVLIVGDTIIETPNVLRSRQYEAFGYRDLMMDYFRRGAHWIAAPKPMLLDNVYRMPADGELAITEDEILFDAANILKLGDDLLYLVSDSGNELGARWLERTLGGRYKVHVCKGVYNGVHIDTTFTPIREGLVLANASYVTRENLPAVFRDWEVIYFNDVIDIGYTNFGLASKYIGLNFFMVNPGLAVIDKRQIHLAKELEKRKIDTIQLQLRHARTLGGGFHCVTLDVRRRKA